MELLVRPIHLARFARPLAAVVTLSAALAAPAWAGPSADIYMNADAQQGIVLSNVAGDEDGYTLLMKAPVQTVTAAARPDVAIAAAPPAMPPKAALVDKVRRFEPWVAQAAREAQVDARLLHAVVATESAYNSAAISPKGARGLMQLMPDTARRYGVQDSFDAVQNLRGGARYLADLLRLFGNDVALALAAYNAGENAVLRHGSKVPPYAETVAYVPKVLGLYRQISALSL